MPKTDVSVQLTGEDGNVFSIIGRVTKAMKRSDWSEFADEFKTKALEAKSYDEVLQLCMEYVEVE